MAGVSLFYILSGFVMSWTARERDSAFRFYRRRLARIYPAFLVAWAISLVLHIGAGSLSMWAFLPPTLLQAWIPVEVAYFAGSAVFWSLSCEAFFYLCFPLIHRLIVNLQFRWVFAVGASAMAVSIGIAILMLGADENPLTRWFLIIFPPLRLMEFIIGVALGVLFRRGFRIRLPVLMAAAIAALAVLLAAYSPYSISRYALTLIPFVLLVGSLATADLSARRTGFKSPPIVKLGTWSYCFYLLHAMVLGVVFAVSARVFGTDSIESRASMLLLLAISLGASILAAWLLHILVERPAERALRPSSRPRIDDDLPVLSSNGLAGVGESTEPTDRTAPDPVGEGRPSSA